MDRDRLIGHLRQGCLDFGLHGSRAMLALPTVVGRAVVFDTQGYSHCRRTYRSAVKSREFANVL